MSHSTKKLGMMFTAIAWIFGFFILSLGFSKIIDQQVNPNQSVSTLSTAEYQEIILQRNRQGHYIFDGEINHQTVTFLVDTGATTTAIPMELQNQLHLKQGVPISVSTANGVSRAYMTKLGQLSIGDIQLFDVRATLLPDMGVNEVLLGMNVLKHMELIQRGDELIIRQYQ